MDKYDQDETDGEYETPLFYKEQPPKKGNFGKQFFHNFKFLCSQRESKLLERPSPTCIDELSLHLHTEHPTFRIGTRKNQDESAIAIKEAAADLDFQYSARSPRLTISPSASRATTNLVNDSPPVLSPNIPNSFYTDLEFDPRNLSKMSDIVEETENMSHICVFPLSSDQFNESTLTELASPRNTNIGKQRQKLKRPYEYDCEKDTRYERNDDIVENVQFDLIDSFYNKNSICACSYNKDGKLLDNITPMGMKLVNVPNDFSNTDNPAQNENKDSRSINDDDQYEFSKQSVGLYSQSCLCFHQKEHTYKDIGKKTKMRLHPNDDKSPRGLTVELLTTESLRKITNKTVNNIKEDKNMGRFFGSSNEKPKEIDNLAIKKDINEFFFYILFMTIACIVFFHQKPVYASDLMRAMERVFIKSEFESSGQSISYENIVTFEDLWAYLNGPFLKGIHWSEEVSMLRDTVVPSDKHILKENRMLGTPRIRQVRIGNHTCDIQELFIDYINECYAPYRQDIEDKQPFGAGTKTAWTYHSADFLENSPYSGYIATYGGGGYYIEMDTCEKENQRVFSYLQQNNWLDRGTRAIFVDFTIYNANLNMFFIAKMVFERPPSGGIVPSWFPKTAHLIRFVQPLDYAILAVQLVYLVAVVTYTLMAIKEVRLIGISKYFKSVWNILDCTIFALSYFVILYFIMSHYRLEPALTSNLRSHGHYVDFDDISNDSLHMQNAASILIFFIFIKVFKFLAFNQIMSQLGRTVVRCSGDVLNFSFMLLIVFAAYAQMGTIMFGHQLYQFKTFYDSLFTLLRANFGDFDYVALSEVDGVIGPLYIFGFVFMVIFIMLNMFLAILCDTYSEVISEEKTKSKSTFKMGSALRCFSNNVLNSKWFPKLLVTRGPNVKWKESLRGLGLTETQVKTIMRRFNKSSRSYISRCGLHYVERVESKRVHQDALKGDKEPECPCPKELRDIRHRLGDLEMSLEALSAGLDNMIFKTEVTIEAWTDTSQDLKHICDPVCYPNVPMKSAQIRKGSDQPGEKCVCGTAEQ